MGSCCLNYNPRKGRHTLISLQTSLRPTIRICLRPTEVVIQTATILSNSLSLLLPSF